MESIFLAEKLNIGDIVNLSDRDSSLIINQDKLHEEDLLNISTPFGDFLTRIVFIDTASVEIELIKATPKHEVDLNKPKLTIVQSVPSERKSNYFIEKSVEIGVDQVIPVISHFSKQDLKRSRKNMTKWQSIIDDAVKQSRARHVMKLEQPIPLSELALPKKAIRLCLATEAIDTKSINEALFNTNTPRALNSDVILAIGPETGWHADDIDIFKTLDFQFVRMEGNILRTETAGIAVGSIIKYIQQSYEKTT